MLNLWNPSSPPREDADPLTQGVHGARLLGADPALTLHGGGNASVKLTRPDPWGEPEELLLIKGSGRDLATIDADGFTPLRLAPLRRLLELESLADGELANLLATHKVRASAPDPSVETLLHLLLPSPFVDHAHPDAFLALCDTEDGEERVRQVYGRDLVVVPYERPGFPLARAALRCWAEQVHAGTVGMALLHHGLVTCGGSAREAYDRMIALVNRAEGYLADQGAWDVDPRPLGEPEPREWRVVLAQLRREMAGAAGTPLILTRRADSRSLSFARHPQVAGMAARGPVTPDHVIHTRPWPLVGREVGGYVAAYRAWFARHAAPGREMWDPAPRIVLDPELGLVAAGRDPREAGRAADLYHHTMGIILRAEALGGYRPAGEGEIFAVEYWEQERAKLDREGSPHPLAGEVALVTGAASGIGKACVAALLERGAAVAGLDLNPAVAGLWEGDPAFLGLPCDITDEAAVRQALERMAGAFGGLDMLILNAGMFPPGQRIESLAGETWRRVMTVNLDANLTLMRECHPLLKRAPRYGRVVVIGSKNVPAPGPGAVAYSASKAALNQMARVAALEWGGDGIRINSIHPNAVFDTAIWTTEVLENRARSYGLTVEGYKTNNILRTEVTSRDVAEMAVAMCSPVFSRTTGAQVPVDGGNERVV